MVPLSLPLPSAWVCGAFQLAFSMQLNSSNMSPRVLLVLNIDAGAVVNAVKVSYTMPKPAKPPAARPATRRAAATLQADGSQALDFVTQVVDYSETQRGLVQQLRTAAEQSQVAAPADAGNAAAASNSQRKCSGGKGRQKSCGQGSGGESPYDDIAPSAGTCRIEAQQNGATVLSAAFDGNVGSADDDLEAESTGLEGQNSSGRARKRSKRLDI